MITNNPPFSNDFALKNQIRRTSISIMSNITEGFDREGHKEFIQFLSTAKASAAEVVSHLYIAYDVEYIDKVLLDTVKSQAQTIYEDESPG